MDEYIDQTAVPQVRELLTNYGKDIPAVIWWDTPTDMNKERADKIHRVVETLRPDLITNNRLGGGYQGDTETPEQHIPAQGYPGRDWETCMTMNNTWGFKKDDNNWKSTETLIRNLCDIASKGGNYLLNVGPTSEGLIPAPSIERLAQVGEWMKVNGEAIYGTGPTAFGAEAGKFSDTEKEKDGKPKFIQSWEWRCTTAPGKLYLEILQWPKDAAFPLERGERQSHQSLLARRPGAQGAGSQAGRGRGVRCAAGQGPRRHCLGPLPRNRQRRPVKGTAETFAGRCRHWLPSAPRRGRPGARWRAGPGRDAYCASTSAVVFLAGLHFDEGHLQATAARINDLQTLLSRRQVEDDSLALVVRFLFISMDARFRQFLVRGKLLFVLVVKIRRAAVSVSEDGPHLEVAFFVGIAERSRAHHRVAVRLTGFDAQDAGRLHLQHQRERRVSRESLRGDADVVFLVGRDAAVADRRDVQFTGGQVGECESAVGANGCTRFPTRFDRIAVGIPRILGHHESDHSAILHGPRHGCVEHARNLASAMHRQVESQLGNRLRGREFLDLAE